MSVKKVAVARKRAKRRNQRVVNDIRQAHQVAIAVIQVTQAAMIRQVVATRHRHQV